MSYKPKTIEEISTEIRLICADLKLHESMFYKDGAYSVLNEYYAPILVAYVTTRAELESVKAELAKAKRTISDLRGGLKEILHNLEDAKQDLNDANKYMLEAAKLNP